MYITCDECKTEFKSNFCPTCGKKYTDVKLPDAPTVIESYTHGSKDSNYDLLNQYGVDEDSELGKNMIWLNMEIKVNYNVVGDTLVPFEADFGDGNGFMNIVLKVK